MKILQVVQKNFTLLGIDPKLERFNQRLLINLAMSALAIALLWIYLLREADSSQEYMESTYFLVACSGIFLSAMSTTFMTKKIFAFFNFFDELPSESMWNCKVV